MRRPEQYMNPEQASIVSCWSRPSCQKGKAVGGRGSNRPKNPSFPTGVVGSACADKVFEATCEIHKRWWVAATNRSDLKWSASGPVEVGGAHSTDEAG